MRNSNAMAMRPGTSRNGAPMDRGILYILAGVIAVFVIVIGVEVGIDQAMTTGIDLGLSTHGTQ